MDLLSYIKELFIIFLILHSSYCIYLQDYSYLRVVHFYMTYDMSVYLSDCAKQRFLYIFMFISLLYNDIIIVLIVICKRARKTKIMFSISKCLLIWKFYRFKMVIFILL